MSLPLSGKTALVTGASRGIGAAIARRLAADGANVVVNYVSNPESAQKVVDELNAKGPGTAVAIKADLSKAEEAVELLKDTVEAFGRVDIIVFNAAVMGDRLLSQVDDNSFDAHFNVNVKSPLFIAQAAEPHLVPGSRLIFLSTTLTRVSTVGPSTLLYVATKGAIEQITRTLALELAGKGINVNCVSPGPVDTDMFKSRRTEEQLQHAKDRHPLKRIGQPEEIADVVAFLAGPDSSWVVGQNLFVNGGLHV